MKKDKELDKCKNDFFYFTENYVKINHWKDGLIPFKLYSYQKRLINDMLENRFVCGVKFRQGGFTTTQVIFALWECMFKNDQHVMTYASRDREAIAIGNIVSRAIENFPNWLKPNLSENNDHMKLFSDTKSSMYFHSPEPGCGKSLTRLIIDESAFIENAERNWKAIFPTISTGGKCSVISTTNFKDNWFYNIITDCKNEKNKFKLYNCSYLEHPEYCKKEWIEQQLKWLGNKAFSAEVMCEFID